MNEQEKIREQLNYRPKELKEIQEIGRYELAKKGEDYSNKSEIIIVGLIYSLLVEKRRENQHCTIIDIQKRLQEKSMVSSYENTCRILVEMQSFFTAYWIEPNDIYSISPFLYR